MKLVRCGHDWLLDRALVPRPKGVLSDEIMPTYAPVWLDGLPLDEAACMRRDIVPIEIDDVAGRIRYVPWAVAFGYWTERDVRDLFGRLCIRPMACLRSASRPS